MRVRRNAGFETPTLALVAVILAMTGVAYAADETTTTTTPETTTSTTLPEDTTTTTVPEGTTTTTEPEPVPEETPPRVGTMTPPPIIFPVVGDHSFIDTFGAPRDGGRRRHMGNDIFAEKLTPVVAVADGTIERMGVGRLAGQYISLRHDDGWRSRYMHLNNDTPGTDDGQAIGFAPGLEEGMHVTAGTLIGFVGDSGNAETTPPHLHFELIQPDGLTINPFSALINATHIELLDNQPIPVPAASGPRIETHNTSLVGYLDPDGSGFNAGLAVHDDHVFMGTWGRRGRCPGTGIRVVEVTDPTDPVKVASFAGGDTFPGTGAEAIWVGDLDTAGFTGTIGVVGLRLCDNGWRARAGAEFAGLAVYDLTDPEGPELLSTVHSGKDTQGVHEIDVIWTDDRLLVAVTVPQSVLHHPDTIGDVRFLDLTDPTEPVPLSDWDLRRDGPEDMVAELESQVGAAALSGHSVTWIDPTLAVVAHSAAGLVTLDLSDPSRPVYVGSASPYDTTEVGEHHSYERGHGHNAHSGWLFNGTVLIQDDQHLLPLSDGDGPSEWGQQVFYDFSDPTEPVLLSTFATENSSADENGNLPRDGYYTVHTSVPFGDDSELVAWFSDGVRVVDLSDPSEPTEIAYFVPPPRADPQGWWVAPDGTREIPMVWGVASDERFVYASDANSGLWIFQVITRQPLDPQMSPQ